MIKHDSASLILFREERAADERGGDNNLLTSRRKLGRIMVVKPTGKNGFICYEVKMQPQDVTGQGLP